MPRSIVSDSLHAPQGLFSHAVVTEPGRLLFSSGFLARDPETGIVGPADDIQAQTRHVLTAIGKVLETAGASWRDVVKMTVHVTRRENYAAMNAVRREMLQGLSYASTAVISQLVDPAALVEIDVVASLPAAGSP